MSVDFHDAAVDAIDDLIGTLRRPLKDTLLIAYNEHEPRTGRQYEANPFYGFFRLVDLGADYAARIERTRDRRDGKKRRAEAKGETWGAKPVAAKNAELEAEIAKVVECIRTVLPPEDLDVLERRKVRILFASLRENERETRQIEADEDWDCGRRREAQQAAQRRMIERGRVVLTGPFQQ